MDDAKLAAIVEAVVKELLATGAIAASAQAAMTHADTPAPVAPPPVVGGPVLTIDLPDPTTRREPADWTPSSGSSCTPTSWVRPC